jgi:hypothetical protein
LIDFFLPPLVAVNEADIDEKQQQRECAAERRSPKQQPFTLGDAVVRRHAQGL